MPKINGQEENMNPKLQKVNREIERAKAKIAELQASLPALEKQKEELENTDWIRALRSADVAPEDFAAFIESYKANTRGGARQSIQAAPKPNTPEETTN
jgi:DNA repair exonuclease SbcCD ATPase subunit